MWIDFHTHILPGMDDGAETVQQSIKMLRILRKQGVDRVALTPHFYAHRESVDSFLDRRQTAFEQLQKAIGHEKMPRLLLGAEVSLECDLEEVGGLEKLCLQDTPYLMLELPIHYHYMPWMLENALSLCNANHTLPMLAHIDRYIGIYTDEHLENIVMDSDALVQINTSSLLHHAIRKKVLTWIKSGRPVILGSDAHNTSSRKPRFKKGIQILSRRVPATTVARIQADSDMVLHGGCPQNLSEIPLLIKER